MPEPTSNDEFKCKCGHVLGREYRVSGQFVGALVGGMMVTESAHGRCVACGRGIHIVVSSKAFLKLMSHYGGVAELTVEITE